MYQRILVPIDGSATSRRGLEEAIRLARLTHGRLRVIHVLDDLSFSAGAVPYGDYCNDWIGYLRETGGKLLAQAHEAVRSAGIEVDGDVHCNFHQRLCDIVAEEALQWGADLIVVGTHGRRGPRRVLIGSGAESILRHAPVPVLLVRAAELADDKAAPQPAVGPASATA